MGDPGYIDVSVQDDSLFLTDNLPYVVRDARHSIVARGTSRRGSLEELPEGLYAVEVMTPRGTQHTELVHVTAGVTTSVVVTEEGARAAEPLPPPGASAPVVVEQPFVAEAGDEPPLPAEAAPAATLLGTTGCALLAEDEQGWLFVPDAELTAVPVARFDLEGTTWEISLPLNPEGAEPVLRQCRVRLDQTELVPRLEVSFGDKRRVCRMLVGMLRENGVAGGAELLDTAAELLLSKYADPAAAALGGLTLHRFGRLQERQSWVENLSRDFAWLPDGRVLCAALLQRDEDTTERERGLDLLLGATAGRPLYTDGLSLALEVLRRWPGDARTEERTERLGRLAVYSAGADWDSIALTTKEGD